MAVKIELERNEIDIISEALKKDVTHYLDVRKKASAAKRKILDKNYSTINKLYSFFQGL